MGKDFTWDFYQRLEELLWELLNLYADAVGSDPAVEQSASHRAMSQDAHEKKVLGIQKQLSLLQLDAGKGKKGDIPLLRLYRLFQPGDFAWFCALLSLAAEWNGEFSRKVGKLQGSYGAAFPTVEFCARCCTLDPAEQKRLMLELEKDPLFLDAFFENWDIREAYSQRPMRLRPRVVQLMGNWESDNPRLQGIVTVHEPQEEGLPPLLAGEAVADRLDAFDVGDRQILFSFYGPQGGGKKLQARHFCRKRGIGLLVVQMDWMPLDEREFVSLLGEIRLEAAVRESYLAFDRVTVTQDHGEVRERASLLEQHLERLWQVCRVVFFLGETEWRPRGERNYGFFSLKLEALPLEDRVRVWESYFQILPVAEDVDVELLAGKFPFTGGMVKNSILEAMEQMQWQGKDRLDSALLHEACSRQVVHHLEGRATRIESPYHWEDLVLPARQKTTLRDACDQVLFGRTVYHRWNFGSKVAYGRGVSLLFTGPPGTGKTMAAQVMANELRMELFKVDLSGMLSKYVGETEKNLGVVFEEMKKSQNILFFDEADALFGKRAEVKDANDRYANAQVAYLLQKMEEYDGVIVLATNLLQNFDEAFKRRLKFVVDFPFPGPQQRREIWGKVFPGQAPVDSGVDLDYLAERFELSGSNIKNIAVAAAFLAAGAREPTISMESLLLALQREYEKMGKVLTPGELGEYASFLKPRQDMEYSKGGISDARI